MTHEGDRRVFPVYLTVGRVDDQSERRPLVESNGSTTIRLAPSNITFGDHARSMTFLMEILLDCPLWGKTDGKLPHDDVEL
jgi:hypothetical protein